jgi:aminomethyltransferase
MSTAQKAPHKTALANLHVHAGAKMVDFAGWEMPIEYSGIRKEHEAVRSRAGLFDLSHMGEVIVEGPGAFNYLQGLVTNDLSKIAAGKAQYNCMCNSTGRVLDDMVVYRFPDHFYVVMNASNREKIVSWMQTHVPKEGVEVRDVSLETSLIAIQGPEAQKLLQPHVAIDLETIDYYAFAQDHVAGIPAIVSRTGYTGEDGFELYVPWEQGRAVWELFSDVLPIGLGARDTLRLESGYALYGHELNEDVTPFDAGLAWIVKLDHDFVGRDALKAQKESGGIEKTVVGLSMEGRTIPREGYPVYSGERRVGTVTSGTFSPSLKRGIALASVETAVRAEGTELDVEIRERRERAKVTRPPFVRGSVRRG